MINSFWFASRYYSDFFSIASATLLQPQFSRIVKFRLSFWDFWQEFAQILHEFANTKNTLNLFLLKSSDLEIQRPTLLGKNNKKLDERSKPVFCLSWLDYSLLLVCFFQSNFVLYYILNTVNKFLLFRGKILIKKVLQENLLKIWHVPPVGFFVNGHQNFQKLKK